MTYNPQAPYTNDETAQPSSWLSMLTGATVVGAIVAAIAYAPDMAKGLNLDENNFFAKAAKAVAPAGEWFNSSAESLKEMLPDGMKGMEQYITGKTFLATAGVAAGAMAGLALKPHHVDEVAGHALPHAIAHVTSGNLPTV